LAGFTPTGEGMYLSSNAFFNGSSWIYQTSAFASQYVQLSSIHRWYTAPSGTAGNAITFTQAMTLDASGNLGIGTTSPRARLHTLLNGNASNGITGTTLIGQNSSSGNSSYLTLVGGFDAEAGIVFTDESIAYRGRIVYSNNNEFMSFWTDGSERSRIFSTGNIAIGSTTDSGERLQVTGTAKITGNLFLSANTYADGFIRTSGGSDFGTSLVLWSNISGNTFLAGYDFSINTGSNNARTTRFSVSNTGNVSMTGNLTVDTNTLFVDATNNRVGVLTTTPSEPLHVAGNMLISGANSFKMRNLAGTDVNVIRAVSGGTSVLSTATLGNNIAIGTQSAHDFLLCSSDQ